MSLKSLLSLLSLMSLKKCDSTDKTNIPLIYYENFYNDSGRYRYNNSKRRFCGTMNFGDTKTTLKKPLPKDKPTALTKNSNENS
jgi:hypothetical protein